MANRRVRVFLGHLCLVLATCALGQGPTAAQSPPVPVVELDAAQMYEAADPRPTLNLAALESLALGRNPTLTQANARIAMSQGAAEQAGLYPNPTADYVAEQIGVNRRTVTCPT